MRRSTSALAGIAAVALLAGLLSSNGASAQNAAACSEMRSQIAQLDQSIANMRSAGASGTARSDVNSQVGLLVNQRNRLQDTYNSYCTGSSGGYSGSSGGGGGDQAAAAIGLLGSVLGMMSNNSAAQQEQDRQAAQEREWQDYLAREQARRAAEEARIAAERAAAEQAARERDARMRQATLSPFDPASAGAANPFGTPDTQPNPFLVAQRSTPSGNLVQPNEREIRSAIYAPVMEDWSRRYPGTCPSGHQQLANYCAARPSWWTEVATITPYTPQQCVATVSGVTMSHPTCASAARRRLRAADSNIDEAVRQARCAEGRAPAVNCDADPDNDVDWE